MTGKLFLRMMKLVYDKITLPFCPCVCAHIWKALVTPINWVCLAWGEAVTINKARVVLKCTKKKQHKFLNCIKRYETRLLQESSYTLKANSAVPLLRSFGNTINQTLCLCNCILSYGHGEKTSADWLKNPLSQSMLKRFPLTICWCKRVFSKMSEFCKQEHRRARIIVDFCLAGTSSCHRE